MLLHLAGQYTRQQPGLGNAKKIAQELFTKSVTAHLSTFLVNDLMTPYYGEDFERALIHLFSAVNYAALAKGKTPWWNAANWTLFFERSPLTENETPTKTTPSPVTWPDSSTKIGGNNDAYISYMKALDAYDAYATFYKTPGPPDLGGRRAPHRATVGFFR
jgi:hypothetical protein